MFEVNSFQPLCSRWENKAYIVIPISFSSLPPSLTFLLFLSDVIKISYEIISIDGWNRERTEGYAIYTVPFTCGRYVENVDCYRDLGDDTWQNWLERYFIGGRRRVQMNEFHAITAEYEQNQQQLNKHQSEHEHEHKQHLLNRYGNSTRSTGQLKICRNVIVQKNIDDIDRDGYDANRITHQKHRKNHKLPTINSVLVAYHRAREKLETFADGNEF